MTESTTAFDTASIPLARRLAIEAEQTQSLYNGAVVGLVASLIAAGILAMLFAFEPPISHSVLEIWLAVMVCQVAARLGLLALYRHLAPPPERRRLWRDLFTLGAAVGGLTWGLGALAIITPANFETQLLLTVVISGLIYASLSGFGSYQPFYALLFCSFTPMVMWSALQGDMRHWTFAALGIVWLPAAAWLGMRHDRDVVASFNLRYENLDLMRDLQLEKERAEKANVAKSRFLASASHDLRQPVHALGMFVGALRAHDMSDPARRLLDYIEGSVGALDGLFTALLDISRLDAGLIVAEPRVFAISPLLQRIWLEARAETIAKPVTVDFVFSSAFVRSDPVLLARVLRNIVANAVRYTVRGRILLGCRRRANRLLVQVWDTGPGIAEDHHERIFEEFFQLENPGRDRSQGLGLGLAVVRRLTRLLEHPLRLSSRPGKGAMFEVTLPLGDSAALPVEALPVPSLPSEGLVLVVDNEHAICEAMRSLLEIWGHDVITAYSGTGMLERIAEIPVRPILIVCDYRLRDGEDGIGVIQRLQSEFNHEIPGILITGDTAPNRLAEAEASGFMLLHKPLSVDRLRFAVQTVLASQHAAEN